MYNKPTAIGCKNEHLFCKVCLDKYFINNISQKCCPQCKVNGLSKQTITEAQFVSRLVNKLKVKCKLGCVWTGTLGDLDSHEKNHCLLFQVKCKHCEKYMSRSELMLHICPKEKIKCEKCESEILKNNMKNHISVCSQKCLINKGSMTVKQREIIAKILKDCNNDNKENFVLSNIRDKLMFFGMKKTIVINGTVFALNHAPIQWSQWKFNKV